MLQQDMVGYTKATLDAGKPESFGLITDFTSAPLNEYLSRVINEVSNDVALRYSTCMTDTNAVHRHHIRGEPVRLCVL